MALSEEEQEQLIMAGWDLLKNVIYEGKVRPVQGKERDASVRDILDAAKFLASKRPPKSRKVPVLDNLLERTDATKA